MAPRDLPGIGPFSAELILIRGAGHPDVQTGLLGAGGRAAGRTREERGGGV
ncbi:hypothetical protein [Streptomyces sp. NPDC058401]|uniref:hypothetical protein n=1 Tax=Streptomyces sp. NPDC058401 TaxID=3346480 RepID=UPI003658BD6A